MIATVQSAPEIFEQTFLLTRAKIQEIAATLDRLDRPHPLNRCVRTLAFVKSSKVSKSS